MFYDCVSCTLLLRSLWINAAAGLNAFLKLVFGSAVQGNVWSWTHHAAGLYRRHQGWTHGALLPSAQSSLCTWRYMGLDMSFDIAFIIAGNKAWTLGVHSGVFISF